MDQVNLFKGTFESIPDHRKVVILMILIANDVDLINDCGFLKNDNIWLSKDFKKN